MSGSLTFSNELTFNKRDIRVRVPIQQLSLPDEACLSWVVYEAPANRTGTEHRTIRSPGANYIQKGSAYYLGTQKLCLQRLRIHEYYGTSHIFGQKKQNIIKSAPVYMPNLP